MLSKWPTRPLGELAETLSGKALNSNSQEVSGEHPYLRAGNVSGWGTVNLGSLSTMPFTDDEKQRYALRVGDLLVVEGGNAGCAAVFQGPAGLFYQNHLHRVRVLDPHVTTNTFLRYSLEFLDAAGVLSSYVSGTTIKGLSAKRLQSLPIPVPGLQEQLRIVDLLSAADSYLADLEAERSSAALVQESVTVDAVMTATYKLSASPLATFLRLRKDLLEPASPSTTDLAGVRNNFGGLFHREAKGSWTTKYSTMQVLRRGDLVIGKIRAQDGGLALVSEEFAGTVLSSEFLVYSVNPLLALPEYVLLSLKSPAMRDAFKSSAQGTGGGKERVTDSKLMGMQLALPDLSTQKRVVDQVEQTGSLVNAIDLKLEAARSLRQQLLHDLMSGNHVIPETYDRLLGT